MRYRWLVKRLGEVRLNPVAKLRPPAYGPRGEAPAPLRASRAPVVIDEQLLHDVAQVAHVRAAVGDVRPIGDREHRLDVAQVLGHDRRAGAPSLRVAEGQLTIARWRDDDLVAGKIGQVAEPAAALDEQRPRGRGGFRLAFGRQVVTVSVPTTTGRSDVIPRVPTSPSSARTACSRCTCVSPSAQ